MTDPNARTRIQRRNREAILEAALDEFSSNGFRGATLEGIARVAGLSKPNILYYFPSKEAIHAALLDGLMETWLDPLKRIDPAGDPVEEIAGYVRNKLAMARRYPRESRLFANEIVHGAPNIAGTIAGPLRDLVDTTAAVIAAWARDGRIAPVDPVHLIFSIWATTQHYADFDAQIRGILGAEGDAHFSDAERFLTDFYRRALVPDSDTAQIRPVRPSIRR